MTVDVIWFWGWRHGQFLSVSRLWSKWCCLDGRLSLECLGNNEQMSCKLVYGLKGCRYVVLDPLWPVCQFACKHVRWLVQHSRCAAI